MKILGWMQRKFRQNTTDHTQKDFSIGFTGQASSDDLQYYPNGGYGSNSKPFSRAQRDNYLRNSFNTLQEAARAGDQEGFDEEPPPNALAELFDGFLAIGTLGTEPLTNDPATPTFSISVDHIAEKATQATENELKLINDELEKVLGAEPRDDASSGRNSHVSAGRNSHVSAGRNSHFSAGRMSHCSAITLGGKAAESGEGCGNEAVVCPLQSYLFGSAVEATDAAPPARKEHRTSLGELFQKTKQAEEKSEKSAVQAVKRMLKRRMVKGTAANSGVMDSAETKLHKILHMFNRKVHPENAISGHQTSHKAIKIDHMKNNNNIESLRPSAEDIIIYPQQCISKQTHLPQLTETNGGDAAGNELSWDNTDADYLVLEL